MKQGLLSLFDGLQTQVFVLASQSTATGSLTVRDEREIQEYQYYGRASYLVYKVFAERKIREIHDAR